MADDPDLDRAYALKTTDDNRAFYRDWAADYDTVFVDETSYHLPDLVAKAFIENGGTWPVLDAGCGTGALGDKFPDDAILDGLDLSAEMLFVARNKGRYRRLIEVDLKGALPLDDGAYAGLVSSGTFTHGHVGPGAFHELIRVLAPKALAVVSVKPEVWDTYEFGPAFEALIKSGAITSPEITDVPVYADASMAPDGHGQDRGLLVQFRAR